MAQVARKEYFRAQRDYLDQLKAFNEEHLNETEDDDLVSDRSSSTPRTKKLNEFLRPGFFDRLRRNIKVKEKRNYNLSSI